MVKVRQVIPGGNGMAGFAARLPAGGIDTHHPFAELSMVRIAMTCDAGTIFKSILRDIFELRRQVGLVAIRTGNGNMSAAQTEASVLMHRKRKGGWPESLHGMAVLTAIQMRRRRELTNMLVFMAIGARSEFQLVNSGGSGRNVTLRASYRGMFCFQRIGGSSVLFWSEIGRFESLDRMTRRALASICPFQELASVRIGRVAPRALVKCKRLVQVSAFVTPVAFNRRMSSQ